MSHEKKLRQLEKEKILLQAQLDQQLDENRLLEDRMEFESVCADIDRILDREKYDNMYDTALKISKDFLAYVSVHPEHDSDSEYWDEHYSDSDYDCDEGTIDIGEAASIQEFCNKYQHWNPEEVRDLMDCFKTHFKRT